MKPRLDLFLFLGLALVGCQSPSASAPVSESLQPYVDRHEVAGAVALVADRNGVLSVDAVGSADIAGGRPMRADTMFWIASQTKGMTAAAVMMLVDEKKLSLDDPVEKYLPEFKGQMVVAEKDGEHVLLRKPKHPVTVREVLSHVSGMPFKSDAEVPVLDGLPLAAAVRTYAMTPLQTEPGTHYQYSNAGINTAARILEVVSGRAYEDFMQERLFTPLGMMDTTFWPDESQTERLAKTYRPNKEKNALIEGGLNQLTLPLSDRQHRFPMPAGGLFSTAQDVSLFCRMLLNNGELNGRRYLSPEAVKELTRRQTPTDLKESYGLGLSVGPDRFGHGGAQATGMEVRPEQGLVLVWMVQHQGFPGKGAEAQEIFKKTALKTFGK